MLIPSDYKDLLRLLNKHKIRYLIVGAYAVIYYTEPRYTKDMNIWIEPTIKNAKKVYEALREFGVPLKGISVEDFTNSNLVYQIGVEPIRVDIMMNIPNIKFSYAWKRKTTASFNGIKINIIGINELLKSKEKTKRDYDIKDIENLKLMLRLKRK